MESGRTRGHGPRTARQCAAQLLAVRHDIAGLHNRRSQPSVRATVPTPTSWSFEHNDLSGLQDWSLACQTLLFYVTTEHVGVPTHHVMRDKQPADSRSCATMLFTTLRLSRLVICNLRH